MFAASDSVTATPLPNRAGATLEELLARLHEQTGEAARLNASLQHAETKIQALTLELAHLKRLRYGVKSEALTAEQRDLFQETLEPTWPPSRRKSNKPHPLPARNASAPAASLCRHICRGSKSATSRTPAPAASAARASSRSGSM